MGFGIQYARPRGPIEPPLAANLQYRGSPDDPTNAVAEPPDGGQSGEHWLPWANSTRLAFPRWPRLQSSLLRGRRLWPVRSGVRPRLRTSVRARLRAGVRGADLPVAGTELRGRLRAAMLRQLRACLRTGVRTPLRAGLRRAVRTWSLLAAGRAAGLARPRVAIRLLLQRLRRGLLGRLA